MSAIHVRWMIRRDLADVVEIDRQGFADPWSAADFLRYLRGRDAIGMVADDGRRVAGFALYRLLADDIALVRLAVAADRRREGIGSRLVAKLQGKIRPIGSRRDAIRCETPEDLDLGACAFFASAGFRAELIRGREADSYRFTFAHALTLEEPCSI